MATRIVVVDDHRLVRAGIVALLEDIPEVEIVGEASDGTQALKTVAELEPDLLILDLSMPEMSGFEVLERIHETHPRVKVIILSMHDSAEHVHRALKLGASGYLLKDVLPDELVLAIDAIKKGRTWLSSAISKTVIDGYLGRNGEEGALSPLTERQSQVLKMIAEGQSTKQISGHLNLSVKTIETYRAQIMEKLDIHDIAGLVRYAIRQGIVPL
ncbi:response regulator [Propionivibrio limicola]|uniref:response regulator n=1 Tax=Propionivibrio limicola TaxID=167645 RepID=UPI001292AB23|nr:response regulator transcription factor [Propionivibrio limicola]